MSFFRKHRPKDKDEFIEMERREYEKRKDSFLNKKAASKELEDSSMVDNNPKTAEHEGPDLIKEERKKKSLRERIEDYKIKRSSNKYEKELKSRKNEQDRAEREEAERKSRERKIFGKELSSEERAEIAKAKEEKEAAREQKKIERTKKVKKAYSTFQNTLGKVEQERSKLASFGTNIDFGVGKGSGIGLGGGLGSGLGSNKSEPMLGNPDFLNALSPSNANKYQSQKLGKDMISFDINFGNSLAGKKANKKPGKHPLSI